MVEIKSAGGLPQVARDYLDPLHMGFAPWEKYRLDEDLDKYYGENKYTGQLMDALSSMRGQESIAEPQMTQAMDQGGRNAAMQMRMGSPIAASQALGRLSGAQRGIAGQGGARVGQEEAQMSGLLGRAYHGQQAADAQEEYRREKVRAIAKDFNAGLEREQTARNMEEAAQLMQVASSMMGGMGGGMGDMAGGMPGMEGGTGALSPGQLAINNPAMGTGFADSGALSPGMLEMARPGKDYKDFEGGWVGPGMGTGSFYDGQQLQYKDPWDAW